MTPADVAKFIGVARAGGVSQMSIAVGDSTLAFALSPAAPPMPEEMTDDELMGGASGMIAPDLIAAREAARAMREDE